MIIKHDDDKIRYTGRWNVGTENAESTANGSYLEFCFKGDTAVIAFDTNYLREPVPHIFVSVDDGARVSTPVDNYVRISCSFGEHRVKVILKGSHERQHRWYHKIESKTALLGIEADEFLKMPEDNRKKIEFLGDSITEGISIDVEKSSYYGNESSMVDWDDATAGYAWLTAEELNLRPYIMGYGCMGITHKGAGGIPKAVLAYPFYSDGCPMESIGADYIVLNYGTNDRAATQKEFKEDYINLLKVIRERNKNSNIISLTPFSGFRAEDVEESVNEYNLKFSDDVFLIKTTGWIDAEPIHPNRENHKIVSKKLAKIFREKIVKE